jgi:hypothetical protein
VATDKQSRKANAPATGKKAQASARSKSHGRFDSEQTARFMLIGGIGLIVLVALAFIGFGYYWTEIRPEHRTVLQVDAEKISLAAMKRRMNYELFKNVSFQQNPSELANTAYGNLVDELVIVNRADDAGASVDDATFDKTLRSRIGVAEEADQRAFQDGLRRQLDSTGLKEAEYRRMIRSEALATALTDKFKAELPLAVTQARIEVISAPSLDVAQQAIARINAGEAFADVAKALSNDPNVATTGGVQGYEAKGGFNSVYDDFVFSTEVGKLSDPISAGENALNYYVVRVIDRSEQPVREDQKTNLANDKYQEWLTNTKEEMSSSGAISDHFSEQNRTDAIVAVYGDAADQIRQNQIAQQEAQNQQATAIAQLTAQPAATPAPAPTSSSAESTPAAGAVTPPAQPPAPSP